MKINRGKKAAGSALLVTLCTILVIAIALTSYLTLVANQSHAVARATAWNQAIPVLEGGIEEALTQIHYYGYSSNALATNNWTLGGDGLVHKQRTYSDGNYYTVSITPSNPPTIVATGFVLVPIGATNQYVSRRVRVTTRLPSVQGITAKGVISMSGGSYIDAFNSTDPNYSSNGFYTISKRKDDVEVLTDATNHPAIASGTGKIYGYAVTGPGGTVTGNVGDAAFLAGSSGVESGHSANNANVQFNDISAPFVWSTGTAATSGTYAIGGTNYTYKMSTGNYTLPAGINLGGGKSVYISGNPTVLYVDGAFTTSGSGYIYIAPGATLDLYINGTGTFSGSAIVNGNGTATNCYLYGMTNCGTMTYSGSSAFQGIVNCPDAAFTYSGSADFSGAIAANTVLLSGGGNVHYDEGINGNGQVVQSWNEF